MAGSVKRQAPVRIADEIIDADKLTERNYVVRDICMMTMNNESTINFLASLGLIHNSAMCCNTPMRLMNRCTSSDGKAWRCCVCMHYRSIRQDSFFSGSRLPLPRLIELIYWWAALDCKQYVVMEQVGIGTEAIVKWYNYFRELCAVWCIDNAMQIGGEGMVVEIDETKFTHQKFYNGRYEECRWILGMVERQSLRCVLVPVSDRNASTLLPIIAQHVLPETRIITDGWLAYQQMSNHTNMNHNLHFVDPNDATFHTNTIERTWGKIKDKYRAMHGTSDNLFETYLQEFCWRRSHKHNMFMSFVKCIRTYYPLS
uniref:ISXO2-like transposase domain-containing protein n=1 Tax=Octopus bimaculoides TaxID=37653 RepID=A0A0L8GDV8_OCTBM|eukprot:XP_014781859.1 PREDICTED: uncharacterized protein LOC106877467 [Octopus bimaculoides]